MLADDDIKKLVKKFKTRRESDEDFKTLVIEIVKNRAEFEQKFENMATKEDFNRVMTAVDAVLGEVKAMRLEQAAHFQQHQDIDEKIKNHDSRLKKMEVSLSS